MLAVQIVVGILLVAGFMVAIYFRLNKKQSKTPTQTTSQPHYYGDRDEVNEHRFSRYHHHF